MTQRPPIPFALAKRKRCVDASLANRGGPIDPDPCVLAVCEPAVHTVRVTRRPHDASLPRLADRVNDRYLDHAPNQLKAESCRAMLIDILA